MRAARASSAVAKAPSGLDRDGGHGHLAIALPAIQAARRLGARMVRSFCSRSMLSGRSSARATDEDVDHVGPGQDSPDAC